MSFVSSYHYDIYVSYAEIDNLPQIGNETGWVTNLISALKNVLGMKLRKEAKPKLCLGRRMVSQGPPTEGKTKNIEQSALLLVILSRGYLESENCLSEVKHFLKILKKRADGSLSQVIVVEKEKLKSTQEFKELSHLFSHRFWKREPSGKKRTLAIPKPNPAEPEFYYRVENLGSDIAKELQRLALKAPVNLSFPPSPSLRGTVFLAEVPENLGDYREAVKRYLNQACFRVLPETSLWSMSLAKTIQNLDENLKISDSYVQLLNDTELISGEAKKDYSRMQYDRANGIGIPILQWRSPDLDVSTVKNDKQRKFLELNTVMAISIEDFKREILLQSLKKPANLPKTKELIFLNTSNEDLELAEKISNSLKNFGLGCILPKGQGSPKEIRRELKENLISCDFLMIVYGNITPNWVREQINYAFKVERERPISAMAIYDGPPTIKDDIELKIPKLKIVNGRKNFNEKEIQEFFLPLMKK